MKYLVSLIPFFPLFLIAQNNFSTAGTYRLGKDIDKENVGEIIVVPSTENHLFIYISSTEKAPSFNTSVLLTEVKISDNKGYYQAESGSGKLGFHFSEHGVTITDPYSIASSHISLHKVEFIKVDTIVPVSFMRGNGELAEINKATAEYRTNYFLNTSLWDFVGIWQYGKSSETLSISKDLSTDAIIVQYNTSADGFEDRYIENCSFKNGEIKGDHYGGKENVLLEMEDGHLLLTIDPFHEFSPIKKQLFAKEPKAVFKYCTKGDHIYIKNGNEIVDSLPPGDRVSVNYQPMAENLNILSYNNRFSKSTVNKTENRYIDAKQLSNVKPLFVSENTTVSFFENYNQSELFVKQLYTPAKFEENIRIVSDFAEQNIAGQKKLYIDHQAFLKLGLENAGDTFKSDVAQLFITGTVDFDSDLNFIVLDVQYPREYYTYLINYTTSGEYLDHVLIGQGDYVESFTYTYPVFTHNELYVNSMKFIDNGQESEYKLYRSGRYVMNDGGKFILSNYAPSSIHKYDTTIQLITQQLQSTTYGNVVLHFYLDYTGTSNSGGYVSAMSTKLETENGMELIIPMDISAVSGFHRPPNGDFTAAPGELQKLFETTINDSITDRLSLEFQLTDVNDDGVDELFLTVTDNTYTIAPRDIYCFVNKGNQWAYSSYNEPVNSFIDAFGTPHEMVFKSYYKNGYPPFSVEIEDDEKQELLLEKNEELLYTFKVESSDKRMCIGVDESLKYVVYRFGTKNNIEFEYIAEYESKIRKFEYYKEDQTITAPRNYLEHLSFVHEGQLYSVFNNSVESELKRDVSIPTINGTGIMVRNLETDITSILKADASTIDGYLGLAKICIRSNQN